MLEAMVLIVVAAALSWMGWALMKESRGTKELKWSIWDHTLMRKEFIEEYGSLLGPITWADELDLAYILEGAPAAIDLSGTAALQGRRFKVNVEERLLFTRLPRRTVPYLWLQKHHPDIDVSRDQRLTLTDEGATVSLLTADRAFLNDALGWLRKLEALEVKRALNAWADAVVSGVHMAHDDDLVALEAALGGALDPQRIERLCDALDTQEHASARVRLRTAAHRQNWDLLRRLFESSEYIARAEVLQRLAVSQRPLALELASGVLQSDRELVAARTNDPGVITYLETCIEVAMLLNRESSRPWVRTIASHEPNLRDAAFHALANNSHQDTEDEIFHALELTARTAKSDPNWDQANALQRQLITNLVEVGRQASIERLTQWRRQQADRALYSSIDDAITQLKVRLSRDSEKRGTLSLAEAAAGGQLSLPESRGQLTFPEEASPTAAHERADAQLEEEEHA